jgi:type II secretory pathway component PulC
VERTSDKEIKIVLLESASKDQIYFLNGIINDIQPQFKEKIEIDQ